MNKRKLIFLSYLKPHAVSSKQFNRIFLDYVGATPKEFLRIVRMQRALFKVQQNPSISFAQLAYECGFSNLVTYDKRV